MTEKTERSPGGSAAPGFVDNYLAYLLARASFLVSSEFHAELSAVGIDVPTWRVLATLSGGEGRPVGELADIVLLKQPTLSKALDRMIKDGLVKRAPSLVDRRQVKVTITEKGRGLVDGLIARARAHEDKMLASYGPEEQETLKRILKTLIGRLSDSTARG